MSRTRDNRSSRDSEPTLPEPVFLTAMRTRAPRDVEGMLVTRDGDSVHIQLTDGETLELSATELLAALGHRQAA